MILELYYLFNGVTFMAAYVVQVLTVIATELVSNKYIYSMSENMLISLAVCLALGR